MAYLHYQSLELHTDSDIHRPPLVVEHYRNLWNFVRVLHEKEEDGTNICNLNTCPRMSAGASVSVPFPVPAFWMAQLVPRSVPLTLFSVLKKSLLHLAEQPP